MRNSYHIKRGRFSESHQRDRLGCSEGDEAASCFAAIRLGATLQGAVSIKPGPAQYFLKRRQQAAIPPSPALVRPWRGCSTAAHDCDAWEAAPMDNILEAAKAIAL